MKVFTLCALLCAFSASAARLHPSQYLAEMHSKSLGGLREVPSHMTRIRREKEDWTEEKAYVTIKFTVPPSKSDEFEEAWLKLESEVKDKEEDWEIFDLKSSSLDNLFYFSYGEWETVDAFMQHLHSDWFKDFAESADELGVMWKLECQQKHSEDLEKEYGRKEKRGDSKEKDLAYVLVQYEAAPGEDKEFIEQWRNTAKKTLSDEKGNRVYSLASASDDNTRFWVYGSWDSMDDYLEHFESDHVVELREYLAKKDIVWFLIPLDKIGNQPE